MIYKLNTTIKNSLNPSLLKSFFLPLCTWEVPVAAEDTCIFSVQALVRIHLKKCQSSPEVADMPRRSGRISPVDTILAAPIQQKDDCCSTRNISQIGHSVSKNSNDVLKLGV